MTVFFLIRTAKITFVGKAGVASDVLDEKVLVTHKSVVGIR